MSKYSSMLKMLFVIGVFLIVVLSISSYGLALANTANQGVIVLHNATNQIIPSGSAACKVKFAYAEITWTNPNLNNSAGGVFNRVAIAVDTVGSPTAANKFIEIGWVKQANLTGLNNGEYILVAYRDSNGLVGNYFVNRPQRNSHKFTIQYDPVVHNKWFVFEDSQAVLDPHSSSIGITSNFIDGCTVAAGGEAVYGYEDMGNTRFFNLGYGTINNSGIISGAYWNSNVPRIYEGRYSCTITTVIDHHCGP